MFDVSKEAHMTGSEWEVYERQGMRFYQWPGAQSRGVLYAIKRKTENAIMKCIPAVNLPEI